MWLISLTLITIIISLWVTWRKRKLTFFQKLNIPSPPASIFFGNYWEILHEGQHNCIKRWIKEYGKVFGYYYGMRPVLIVADLDLLKTIQLKEFHNFSNRAQELLKLVRKNKENIRRHYVGYIEKQCDDRWLVRFARHVEGKSLNGQKGQKIFDVGPSSRKFNQHSITTLEGKKWKDMRSVITPTFTTSKLKTMSYIVDGAIDELLDAIEKKTSNGKPFDLYPFYQNLTMDVIARTALGLHSNAQGGTNDVFVKLARIIFSFSMSYMMLLTFSFTEFMRIFSFLRNLRFYIKNEGRHPRADLQEKVHAAIRARRSDPSTHRPDVLQLLIDAKRPGENVTGINLTAGENDETVSNGSAKEGLKRSGTSLADDEIEHNAVVFLLAGYETTSTALAFITYCLAYHQDVQDKVRDEINENVPDNKSVTYEAVYNLQYLEKVINEALRMYPPITYFISRTPATDTTIGGVFIPKGMPIQVPVYNLHYDPELWEDPETFNPERFSPEEKRNRHPMAFQPFGAGPRNCVGMRFAQMEIKMALAKILKKYKILPKKGSKKEDFAVEHTILTLRPKDGVVVELEKL